MRIDNPKGIHLREFKKLDVDEHYLSVKRSLPELRQWFSFCLHDYVRKDSEYFIESRIASDKESQHFHFAIVDANDLLLGSCSVRIDKKNNKIGIINY